MKLVIQTKGVDQKLLKLLYILLVLLGSSTATSQVGTSLSFFSLKAKTSRGSQSLANLGHFQVGYELPVFDKIRVTPSYSLYILGSDLSDLGYGLNVGVSYFPFSLNRSLVHRSSDLFIHSSEQIRPYISLSFHQRQYQSIQSTYAGLGVKFGTDYQWKQDTRLNFWIASLSLSGPLESKLTELQIGAGTSLDL